MKATNSDSRAPHGVLPPAQPSPDLSTQRLRDDAIQRALAFGMLLLPVAGSLLVSFVVTPAAIEAGLVLTPPCAFKTLFGVPCLSCGMTRAFTALSHGQIALAWSYNKLSPFMYVAFWGLFWWGAWNLLRAVRDLVRLGRPT